ncbi:hypothetical protein N9R08_02490 [Flavobacteriaceae bacterium]|nr:hypothetical protein [Flavobacteriaceae bacterium]
MRSVSVKNSTKINDSEYAVLRSYALGLSDVSIRQLLSLELADFNRIQSRLFQKLDVQNPYFAVKRAYEKGLLCAIGYTDEVVKTKTLAFLENHIRKFQELPASREKAIWECYDLLLEFRNNLNEIREKSGDHKKIPPKRD